MNGQDVPWTYPDGTFTDSLVDNIPNGYTWNGVTRFHTIGTIFKFKEKPHCFWATFDTACKCFEPQPWYYDIAGLSTKSKIIMLKV